MIRSVMIFVRTTVAQLQTTGNYEILINNIQEEGSVAEAFATTGNATAGKSRAPSSSLPDQLLPVSPHAAIPRGSCPMQVFRQTAGLSPFTERSIETQEEKKREPGGGNFCPPTCNRKEISLKKQKPSLPCQPLLSTMVDAVNHG